MPWNAGAVFIAVPATGSAREIRDIDLLVAGDGRYSVVRQAVLGGPETPHFLDVCLYRILVPAGPDCPIDDYGQWFNGPNRLLAFRVPGDTGINYRADTWHHPLAALEREARFVVLTFVDGTASDEQFVPLQDPISIAS